MNMFSAATNPYDEIVVKATSEDLVGEDWDTNLQICDKVLDEGEPGAKNAVGSLIKRLVHRNPNVQMFALELANSLALNCGEALHRELSSRAWTGAVERLITDRSTVQPVRNKALAFVQSWTKDFGNDPAMGVMGELFESLKAKKYTFPDNNPASNQEDDAERRLREEEEELQRVLELSKQDRGGRNANAGNGDGGGGSSSSAYNAGSSSSGGASASRNNANNYTVIGQTSPDGPPLYNPHEGRPAGASSSAAPGPATNRVADPNAPKPFQAREPSPAPLPTHATANRVRAIYPFVTQEKAELSFEKGDVIKVIDRMYDEWYTGAVGGRIGIFPISYVEPLADPTAEELQKEAQEEARVFAAQGMIVNLQRMLDSLDPSKGDRLDSPELEEMYQKTVALQPQIMALMKKYADQKAELEHIHLGFVKASRQYASMTQTPALYPAGQPYPGQPAYGYEQNGMPNPMQATQRHASGGFPPQQQSQGMSQQAGQPGLGQANGSGDRTAGERQAAEQHAAAWAQYYQQMAAIQAQAQGQGHPGMQAQASGQQVTQPQAQAQSQPQQAGQAQPGYQQSQQRHQDSSQSQFSGHSSASIPQQNPSPNPNQYEPEVGESAAQPTSQPQTEAEIAHAKAWEEYYAALAAHQAQYPESIQPTQHQSSQDSSHGLVGQGDHLQPGHQESYGSRPQQQQPRSASYNSQHQQQPAQSGSYATLQQQQYSASPQPLGYGQALPTHDPRQPELTRALSNISLAEGGAQV